MRGSLGRARGLSSALSPRRAGGPEPGFPSAGASVRTIQTRVQTIQSHVQTFQLRVQTVQTHVQTFQTHVRTIRTRVPTIQTRVQNSQTRVQTIQTHAEVVKISHFRPHPSLDTPKSPNFWCRADFSQGLPGFWPAVRAGAAWEGGPEVWRCRTGEDWLQVGLKGRIPRCKT